MSLEIYRSTRTVQAMQIESLSVNPDLSATLRDSDGSFLNVTSDFMTREKPSPGGYYMKNSDGFETFVNSEIFKNDFLLSEE